MKGLAALGLFMSAAGLKEDVVYAEAAGGGEVEVVLKEYRMEDVKKCNGKDGAPVRQIMCGCFLIFCCLCRFYEGNIVLYYLNV